MLQKTCKESMDVVKDTELESRITGVATQMETFDYLYGFMLGKMILGHSVNLSRTMQERNTSVAEGQEVAEIAVQTLQGMCTLTNAFIFASKGWLSRKNTCTSRSTAATEKESAKTFCSWRY